MAANTAKANEYIGSFARTEMKYLLSEEQATELEETLLTYMNRDLYPRYTICSIYYDTPGFDLIQRSIDKAPGVREKFRLRSYGGIKRDDQMVFAEIKQKLDGVIYKRRIGGTFDEVMEALYAKEGEDPKPASGVAKAGTPDQVYKEVSHFFHKHPLEEKICISYDRIALSGKDDPELRVTFDRNVRYRLHHLDLHEGDYGEKLLIPGKVILEVKSPTAFPLWISHLLSKRHIYPTSFSKYGTCYRTNMLTLWNGRLHALA